MSNEPAAREPNVVIIERPSRTEYVDRHITIEERRAPTDASVALLREMEAKAEAEVIKSVVVGDTTFECVVHHFRDEMSDLTWWRAIFKLNEKQMIAEATTYPRQQNHPRDHFVALRNEMAKVIAGEVLNAAFLDLMRERFVR